MTLRATPGTRHARATTRPVSYDRERTADVSLTVIDDASATAVDDISITVSGVTANPVDDTAATTEVPA